MKVKVSDRKEKKSINPEKILFIGRFPPPIHGASIMNQNYFEALKKDKNFKVRKIKINYSKSLDKLGSISLGKFLYTIKSYIQLEKELLLFKPNKIYFEIAPKGTAFIRDSLYVFICKLFRKKIIFQFHAKGVRGFIKDKLFLKKYYRFIFKNSKIILLSNILYPDIKKIVHKKQIEIIPNGIKDEISEKDFEKILKTRNKNKKLALLFLSNMIEDKGPLDVLNICNKLNKRNLKFECLFIGKFKDEKFKEIFFKKLNEFKLSKKCKYLGAKYGNEKFKILERTNYLIFPTKYSEECFPLVILESFMYGIPVLSYNNAAIKEIINSNYLGTISEKGDWQKLAKDVIKRINKKENPKKIREHFKKNYHLPISEKKFKKIINT